MPFFLSAFVVLAVKGGFFKSQQFQLIITIIIGGMVKMSTIGPFVKSPNPMDINIK